jgi:amino acid transporter
MEQGRDSGEGGEATAVSRREGRLVRGLGPIGATALTAGNIIGSGIYVIPASLAAIAGPVSIFAWVINAGAFLCLTAVFADLGGAWPVSGGPQSFVARAFGRFAGLQVSYLYWISSVISNTAFITAFVGYFAVFFPRADRRSRRSSRRRRFSGF